MSELADTTNCPHAENPPGTRLRGASERALVAARLTSPGRGAVATVRVCGDQAIQIVAEICRCDVESFARKTADGRLWVGRWRGQGGEPVVVHVERVDLVDINCHGGLIPSKTVLDALAAASVEILSAHEFVERTCESPVEAEAMAALAEAPTLRTAEILLAQYHGALARAVAGIRDSLGAGRVCDADRELRELLTRASVGLHIVRPWRVAIVGRPNVGKSSLLNAIVGFDRAIVHTTAGTTRDLVTAETAVDGWPVEFCDSAGIRAARDAIESAGVERARRAIADSDLQIVVLDRSQPLSPEDHAILRLCSRPIVAANKSDLAVAPAESPLTDQSFAVSARTGQGIERLLTQLGSTLVSAPPALGAAVPFTLRQVELLRKALDLARSGNIAQAEETLAS